MDTITIQKNNFLDVNSLNLIDGMTNVKMLVIGDQCLSLCNTVNLCSRRSTMR